MAKRRIGGIELIVNIVALAEALFYLCAVPVHLAVRLEGLRAGAGLAVFEGRSAFRRARRDAASKPEGRSKAPDLRRALRVLARMELESVRLTGRVALGDAAATALACGGLNGLARSFRGRTRRMRVDVRPDFGSDIALELDGMIRARSGQIILAALRVWIEEVFPWTTIRLKT